MKGNEARIVLFLHPVKEFKGGQMSKEKPKSMIPRLRSTLPFLGIALVLGVLTFVVYRFTNKQFTDLEAFTTAVFPLKTTTTDTPPYYNTHTPITMNTLLTTANAPNLSTGEAPALPTKSQG